VLAHNAPALTRGLPGIEKAPELTPQVVQLGNLSLQKGAHMNARPWLCAPKRNDAPYLAQSQSETPGLRDEVEHAEDIGRIRAIARWGASGCRENAPRLIQP